jgi:hypothetical protein
VLAVVAVVLLGAGLLLGRRVGGWRGLSSLAGLTAFGALALFASGEQPAAAAGLGFMAMLVHGAAEPEQAGWCGVRLGRGRGVACRRRLTR